MAGSAVVQVTSAQQQGGESDHRGEGEAGKATTQDDLSETRTREKSQKKKAKQKNSKTSTGGRGRSGCMVDALSSAAQTNAHYTCHNVQDLLACRGYPWPLGQARQGGKSKKK
ncbi:small lysine-rich protein 1-like [Hyalella azteca]|uniref:Small lysine-rich protein 1-like n=1 Tax=Hyalella azteca TaxID=294128 RepID=A0A8B7PA16_HYAAZ|nr:small lysine-rich protein 1-like [Hyalella azteca]